MIIDLNKLNRFGKILIESECTIDESFYKNTDIKELKKLYVKGSVEIDYDNILNFNLTLTGIMILPCAITLKDVPIEFQSNIEENLTNFEEILKNNKNRLDISEILWENIVLEIPIRVVDKNVKPSNTTGDGWELISE